MKTLLPLTLLTFGLLAACGDKSGDDTGATDITDGGSADGGTDVNTDGGSADGGSSDGGSAAAAEVHPIDPDTLYAWQQKGSDLLLINVHTPHSDDIPGTDAAIGYTDTDALVAEIGDDLDRLVVLYCKSGPMSAAAADDLVALDYRNVWDLQGGMNAWEAAGYSLE